MTTVWTVKTQRKRISSHLKNGSPAKPNQYKLVCEQNVFCYRDFRSYLKANYPKCFQLLLKVLKHSKWIEWCSPCSTVCCCHLLLFTLNFKSVFSLQRIFDIKSSPARIYSQLLNSAFLCLPFCSICMRNRLRFTNSKHCFADNG